MVDKFTIDNHQFHFLVNVHWGGHKPSFFIVANHDVEEQSPNVTVIGGKARIIKWFSGASDEIGCDGGMNFNGVTFWYVNLTEWEAGVTQVSLDFGGERQEHGGRYEHVPPFPGDVFNSCGEAAGTGTFTQGSGPRGDGPPGARWLEAALVNPVSDSWALVEEPTRSNWNYSVTIYNGHWEIWERASTQNPDASPLWPTPDTDKEATYDIPEGLDWHVNHILHLKDPDPHCESTSGPTFDEFEGVAVRKSPINILTHSQPITSNTGQRAGPAGEWIFAETFNNSGFTYTLQENWKYDDMYAGAYFDDWGYLVEEGEEPSDLQAYKRIQCD